MASEKLKWAKERCADLTERIEKNILQRPFAFSRIHMDLWDVLAKAMTKFSDMMHELVLKEIQGYIEHIPKPDPSLVIKVKELELAEAQAAEVENREWDYG
jgi:hypothetical protein